MTTNSTKNQYPFLRGGGEMGERTRNHDWAKTSLGTPDRWPQSLRTTVSILLKARPPMVLFWGPELLCFYNDAYCPGLDKAGKHPAALGKPGAEVWTETWTEIRPLIDQALAGEDAPLSEQQLMPVHRGGRIENASWTFSYSSIGDESGQPVGVLVSGHETPVPYTPDQPPQIAEQRFQNLVRDIPIGIIVLGEDEMRVQTVNQAYTQLIDHKREELLGKPLFSVIPESESYFRPLIDQVRRTGKSHSIDNQPYHVSAGGKRKEGFINVVYQPYREQDGTISGVMVLCQDVTEQRLAQQQLKVSEAKLRSLIESAPFPIGVYEGPEMLIQFANQSILDVWGKGNDVIGHPYAAVLPELASQGIFEQLSEVYTTGVAFHANNQRVDLVVNGTLQPFYFKYSFTPLYDENRRVYGVMNTAAEVTDLVVARQKQAEAEVSLRSAIELAQLATWSLDIPTGTFSYSTQFMNWLGMSQSTKQLEKLFDFVPEDYRSSVADALTAAIQPGSSGLYMNEHPIVNRLTGEQRIIHVQAQVTFGTSGEPLLLSGMAQDVTQQRMLQTALEQQVIERTEELASVNEELAATNEELAAINEELTSSNEEYASINEEYMAINEELTESTNQLIRSNENLQRFAYIASHDLQEPLRKIQSFGDLLRSGYGDQLGEGTDYLIRMQSAASRMSTLIKDLLTFSRIATDLQTHSSVSLEQLVQLALTDLELIIAETGALLQVGNLPTVVGDAAQLNQLFTNLLSNALKFRRVDDGGVPVTPRIEVSSRSLRARELPDTVKPSRAADWYYQIDVADNGVGFDEKYVDRIFQVFQRLHGKNEFAGTGIGLAICEKVAANHGGAITAISKPGQGATFQVFLPMQPIDA